MVTRFVGIAEAGIDEGDLMRSRLSRTAVSGMPTMTKSRAEPDEYMSTSTSIR